MMNKKYKVNNTYKFKMFIARILLFPIFLLSLLIPKVKNIWIFGSRAGMSYNENSKYFFEYLKTNKKHIKSFFITKNKNITNKQKNILYQYSLKGIIYTLIAKNVFFTVSYLDFDKFLVLFFTKSTLIQMWHGTPLKNLENQRRGIINLLQQKIIISYLGRGFDYGLSPTNVVVEELSKHLVIRKENIIVSGYPRNDVLFNKKVKIKYLESLKKRINFQKVVFYLPTYRGYLNDKKFNLFKGYGFSKEKMTRVLRKYNAILIAKLHPSDLVIDNRIIEKSYSDSKYIYIISENEVDSNIYPLLSKIDILLSDYSGVYFDFLLLDKPIIFAPFDIKIYKKKTGFYYDYQKVTPGPKAKNWSEVLVYMKEALENPNIYREQRKKINDMFNKYQDGKSCERLYNILNQKFL